MERTSEKRHQTPVSSVELAKQSVIMSDQFADSVDRLMENVIIPCQRTCGKASNLINVEERSQLTGIDMIMPVLQF